VTRKKRRTSRKGTKKRKAKGKSRRTSKKKGESSEGEEDEEESRDVTEMLTGDSYECPECTARSGRQVESRATLIVCPDSILTQWQQEIERHTKPGALKVPCPHFPT
jgi:E3 ubiquitin-protein ligase SHPRH